MAYRWPAGTVCNRMTLDVEDRSCPVCGRYMHVCDHRYHHLWTFQGATEVINRLVNCPDPSCESRGRTFSPEAELSISMPRWCLGWDVFCWLGHRRFARHWSVPQLRLELNDTHRIRLSEDAIETYIGRYQTMLAARQQDPARLAEAYRDIESLVLTIDGLQPEKGHETLYVVRELTRCVSSVALRLTHRWSCPHGRHDWRRARPVGECPHTWCAASQPTLTG